MVLETQLAALEDTETRRISGHTLQTEEHVDRKNAAETVLKQAQQLKVPDISGDLEGAVLAIP